MSVYKLLQTDTKLAPGSDGRGKSQAIGDIRQGPTGRFALILDALPHHAYRLVDAQTENIVKGQRIFRKGKNLLIEVNGETVVNFVGFFSAESSQAAPGPTTKTELADAKGGDSSQATYIFDAGQADCSYALIDNNTPSVSSTAGSDVLWAPGQAATMCVNPVALGIAPVAALGGSAAGVGVGTVALGGGAAVAAAALAGAGPKSAVASPNADNIVQGFLTMGDVVEGTRSTIQSQTRQARLRSTLRVQLAPTPV